MRLLRQLIRASAPLALVASTGAVVLTSPGVPAAGASHRVVLAATSAPVPPGAQLVGQATASNVVHLEVALRPRDPAALAAAVSAVSTPGSPSYHHFLAPGEFASQYGPDPASVAAVGNTLAAAGLSVGAPSGTGLALPVSGTVAAVDAAFSTTLSTYRLASGGFGYRNDRSPSLPATIAGKVQAVLGLDTLSRPVPLSHPAPLSHLAPLSRSVSLASPARAVPALRPAGGHAAIPEASGPTPGASCSGTLSGLSGNEAPVLAQAYSLNSLYAAGASGAGTSIGLVEFDNSGYSSTDLAAFTSCYGINLRSGQIQVTSVDGGTNSTATGSDPYESELDIETALQTAPAAGIDLYVVGSAGSADPLYDVLNKIVNDDSVKIVSTSWSNGCEEYVPSADLSAENSVLQAGALEGQSFFVAAGDSGSAGCNSNGSPTDVTTGTTPAGQAVDPATGTLYVANHGDSSLSVIDEGSGPLLTLATPYPPSAVAFDATDRAVFAADYDGTHSALSEVATTHCNATDHTACSVTPVNSTSFSDPVSLALDGSTLYVGNAGNATVTALDAASGTVLGSVSLPSGADPVALAVGANHSVYVADAASGAVDYFAGTSCDVASSSGCSALTPSVISGVGGAIGTLAIDPSADRLYVADGAGRLDVVDTATKALANPINLASGAAIVPGSTHVVRGVALAPNGTDVLAVDEISNGSSTTDYLVTIDPSTARIVSSVSLGTGGATGTLVSDPRTDFVWATDAANDSDVLENLTLSVDNPAGQPDVTGVGGTSLSASGPPPTESVWNDATDYSMGAGGGGISQSFAMPSYQSPLAVIAGSSGTPCANASGDCREVPDVSANADPATGYDVYVNGAWLVEGGTSAAAPLWAGVLAEVASANADTAGYGLFNGALYALAGAHPGTFLNDVTSGNNDYNAANGGTYAAGAGYDMASGLGTPIAAELASGVGGGGTLSVAPSSVTTGASTTLTFTYTAPAVGVSNGELTLTVPSGWSAPSTTAASAGAVTSSCGSAATSAQTITVHNLSLAGGGTCTLTYGATSGGGPGASAPSSAGTSSFAASEQSAASGQLAPLGAAPAVTVSATTSGGGSSGAGGGGSSSGAGSGGSSGGGSAAGGGGAAPGPVTTTTSPSTTTTAPPTTTTAPPATTTTLPAHPVAPKSAPPPPGVPRSLLGTPKTATIGARRTTLTDRNGSAFAALVLPTGALPTGTELSIYPVAARGVVTGGLAAGQSALSAFAVTWQARAGAVPVAHAALRLTLRDRRIAVGDAVEQLAGRRLVRVATARAAGSVTVAFVHDPTFVVAAVPNISLAAVATALPGAAHVTVSCRAAACRGSIRLVVRAPTRVRVNGRLVTRWRALVVARGAYGLGAGRHAVVRLAATPAGRAVLAGARAHPRPAVAWASVTGGATSHRAVLLR